MKLLLIFVFEVYGGTIVQETWVQIDCGPFYSTPVSSRSICNRRIRSCNRFFLVQCVVLQPIKDRLVKNLAKRCIHNFERCICYQLYVSPKLPIHYSDHADKLYSSGDSDSSTQITLPFVFQGWHNPLSCSLFNDLPTFTFSISVFRRKKWQQPRATNETFTPL